jgi:hypothetical protein
MQQNITEEDASNTYKDAHSLYDTIRKAYLKEINRLLRILQLPAYQTQVFQFLTGA